LSLCSGQKQRESGREREREREREIGKAKPSHANQKTIGKKTTQCSIFFKQEISESEKGGRLGARRRRIKGKSLVHDDGSDRKFDVGRGEGREGRSGGTVRLGCYFLL